MGAVSQDQHHDDSNALLGEQANNNTMSGDAPAATSQQPMNTLAMAPTSSNVPVFNDDIKEGTSVVATALGILLFPISIFSCITLDPKEEMVCVCTDRGCVGALLLVWVWVCARVCVARVCECMCVCVSVGVGAWVCVCARVCLCVCMHLCMVYAWWPGIHSHAILRCAHTLPPHVFAPLSYTLGRSALNLL